MVLALSFYHLQNDAYTIQDGCWDSSHHYHITVSRKATGAKNGNAISLDDIFGNIPCCLKSLGLGYLTILSFKRWSTVFFFRMAIYNQSLGLCYQKGKALLSLVTAGVCVNWDLRNELGLGRTRTKHCPWGTGVVFHKIYSPPFMLWHRLHLGPLYVPQPLRSHVHSNFHPIPTSHPRTEKILFLVC